MLHNNKTIIEDNENNEIAWAQIRASQETKDCECCIGCNQNLGCPLIDANDV